jgi:signal peptidase I
VLALLFRYFIGTPTIVKQISMYPTLVQDQRLWLNRWTRTTKTMPERGDIITFEAPSKKTYSVSEIDQENPIAKYENEPTNILSKFTYYVLEWGKDSYIKRVIALPGEHVEIKDGKVYINGEELQEDYLQEGVVTDVVGAGFDDFIVPENYVFAMGDNRNHSTDCRAFGCIPLEKIESKVYIRIWPLNLWGKVD